MSQNLTNEKSALVQVMAWCRQAPSHYLSQCWFSSISPYSLTRPQWVNCPATKQGSKAPHIFPVNWTVCSRLEPNSTSINARADSVLCLWALDTQCSGTLIIALKLFRKYKDVISFSMIFQHWDDAGSWNPSLWKTRMLLSCISIWLLLMTWRRKEPGHQLPSWY